MWLIYDLDKTVGGGTKCRGENLYKKTTRSKEGFIGRGEINRVGVPYNLAKVGMELKSR